MKNIIYLFLLSTCSLSAQKDTLNKYKYILVKSKFDFVKTSDQYQTSSLTKYLLAKKGYEVYLDNENLPNDVAKNRCLTLYADIIDKSGLFTTKSILEIKDCYNSIVYSSETGKSKIKEYKKSYHESIREAVDSFLAIPYEFEEQEPSKSDMVVTTIPVVKTTNEEKETIKKQILTTVTKEESFVDLPVLYAQKKDNGYQLVNTKPKVIFFLLPTKKTNKFIIKDMNGTLLKSDGFWIAEYYNNVGELVEENYIVKF